MMSNFKYLEKKIMISVKYRQNSDFTSHKALVFGPIKLFNSLNVLRKTK